jgi:dihydroorotate dehydrogenase (fumarate)
MTNLATDYLGLRLRSPLIASPGPLTAHLDSLSELAESGAGAVVLPSVFEEQLERDTAGVSAIAPDSDLVRYNLGIESYLALIRAARSTLQIPVIASINGTNIGDWIRYSRLIEDAGADALELNLYSVAADPRVAGNDLEMEQLELVSILSDDLAIPLSVKISPYYSSLGSFVLGLQEAGAQAVTMFNRFYQPSLDPETLAITPRIELSTPAEVSIPVRWIGILSPHLRIQLAASTGIHSGLDVAAVILAGSSVAMTTSALLRNGADHLITMEAELRNYMERHGFESIDTMRGRAHQAATPDPDAYERANYIGVLATSWQQFDTTD